MLREGEQMAVKSASLTLYELYLNQKSGSGFEAAGPAVGLVAEALRHTGDSFVDRTKRTDCLRPTFHVLTSEHT